MTIHPHARRRSSTLLASIALLCAALLCTSGAAAASPAPARSAAGAAVQQRHVCADPAPGYAACQVILDSASDGQRLTPALAEQAGLQPYQAADLQAAYRLPGRSRGGHPLIAIVDAYDAPTAEADLSVYRAANNLPPCTTSNGCFSKVNQHGGSRPPEPDAGWAVEISLDLDMVSAGCPTCRILLVEANNNGLLALGKAVNQAVRMGAVAVSNSYGAPEYGNEAATMRSYYDHPGVVITASTGDSGYGVSVPAAASTVIAVGGSTLYRTDNQRGWAEKAWGGAGSGCSALIAKPAWQHDTLCPNRTVADAAAVADPDTPVAVYDTYDVPGWIYTGGTSVASPLVAAVYGLAGNAADIDPGPYLYAHTGRLFDVTGGSTGYCGGSYLCTGTRGYDGPTGWGTPNGIGAF